MIMVTARQRETTERFALSSPIDVSHLAAQTLYDRGLELEVLRLFDEMSHTYLGRLESSTTVEQLLQHLHTMRGAALGVGAFRLAELSGATEAELRDGQPVNPERIQDIAVAVEEVSAFIAERIESAAA